MNNYMNNIDKSIILKYIKIIEKKYEDLDEFKKIVIDNLNKNMNIPINKLKKMSDDEIINLFKISRKTKIFTNEYFDRNEIVNFINNIKKGKNELDKKEKLIKNFILNRRKRKKTSSNQDPSQDNLDLDDLIDSGLQRTESIILDYKSESDGESDSESDSDNNNARISELVANEYSDLLGESNSNISQISSNNSDESDDESNEESLKNLENLLPPARYPIDNKVDPKDNKSMYDYVYDNVVDSLASLFSLFDSAVFGEDDDNDNDNDNDNDDDDDHTIKTEPDVIINDPSKKTLETNASLESIQTDPGVIVNDPSERTLIENEELQKYDDIDPLNLIDVDQANQYFSGGSK